jgi:hypothetical protein
VSANPLERHGARVALRTFADELESDPAGILGWQPDDDQLDVCRAVVVAMRETADILERAGRE